MGAYLSFLFGKVTDVVQYPILLNVFGLALDFIGVILLSDQFIKVSEKFKQLHELVLGAVLAAPFMFSIGLVLYSIIGVWFDMPISELWMKALTIITLYVGVTLYGFDSIADELKLSFMANIRSRCAYYGWFMLLSGITLQMYSSLIQLGIA